MSSVSIEQLIALNDEIVSLVRGGMPLDAGLRELGRSSGAVMRRLTEALTTRMENGASLDEALAAEQSHLPPEYRAVVTAGLRSGRLPVALEAVSSYARELIDVRRQVSLALLYPLMVTVLAYVLFTFFVAHAVERFRETYDVFRIPVPWSLSVVAEVSAVALHYWWALPLLLILLVLWWMSSGGAQLLSFRGLAQPLSWIPFVGWISRQYRRANFAELLALMLEQEVPLQEALRLSAAATGDHQLIRSAEHIAAQVERGQMRPAASERRLGLPPFLYWVLTGGQQGTEMVRLLRHAASISRRKAVTWSRWFRTLFPVAAALVIGGGVTALYALTLFGPMVRFWHDLGAN